MSLEVMIELNTEHHMPYLCDVYLAKQVACSIEHRKNAISASAYLMHNLPQFHVRIHSLIVAVDNTVKTHQCEHGMVGVVGDELSLARQSHTINTVRFEYIYSKVCAHGDYHQRHEEVVARGNLSNEEHTSERCVHHSRHHSRHTQQGIVFLWQEHSYLIDIP